MTQHKKENLLKTLEDFFLKLNCMVLECDFVDDVIVSQCQKVGHACKNLSSLEL